mmetsp:Transcript_33360/g.100598  ORF Transcript_33360/g.100598 Transcript_33360/m.100598 type:complete len:254 (-) Transcript_33360:54-815(-)
MDADVSALEQARARITLLEDENRNLRETLADYLATIRAIEQGDDESAVGAAAATRDEGASSSDSEDDLPLAELRRRRAARDESESDEEDASESDEQAAGARPRKRPRTTAAPRTRERTSKYYGVRRHRSTKKFRACYTDRDSQNQYIGFFDNEADAAHAYNAALRAHGLESIRKVNAVDEQGRLVAKPKKSSSFYGVTWAASKWRAQAGPCGSSRKHLGCFDDETAAAHAVDAHLYEHHPAIAVKKANFPREE